MQPSPLSHFHVKVYRKLPNPPLGASPISDDRFCREFRVRLQTRAEEEAKREMENPNLTARIEACNRDCLGAEPPPGPKFG
jgi:hypothetical protein